MTLLVGDVVVGDVVVGDFVVVNRAVMNRDVVGVLSMLSQRLTFFPSLRCIVSVVTTFVVAMLWWLVVGGWWLVVGVVVVFSCCSRVDPMRKLRLCSGGEEKEKCNQSA